MPTINIDDILVVTNNEPNPRRIKWNARDYELLPGRPTFIPAPAVFVWFGDPRSGTNIASYTENGVTSFIPDRATEVRRLRYKYAIHEGDERDFSGNTGATRNTPDAWQNAMGEWVAAFTIPDVTIATADGEPVTSVFADPAGNSVNTAVQTVASQEEMMAMIQRQQRQLALMAEQLGGEAFKEDADGLPTDDDDLLVR